ncbi:hypothetical protein [Rhodococcus sp. OK302]|uniref:hypothetical protein n=1 Tax=Rhodococcus sp. OK302 TaxID=1882769 RepID=UPI000B941E68|nr:hypothetical protein [Rhodococcus sp. OK302]OYD60814.1 hypothetical protein BDB13_5704 [Rhodococcus sp. OK302]
MRKTVIDNPVRRRVAITAAGIAAVAAIAVPGVAWASGGLSETAPVVVSDTAAESVPAMQSDTPNGECARALTPEEVYALVAKGELNLADITPAAATEPAVVASAEEIRARGADETVASADAQNGDVTPAVPAC